MVNLDEADGPVDTAHVGGVMRKVCWRGQVQMIPKVCDMSGEAASGGVLTVQKGSLMGMEEPKGKTSTLR